MIPSNTLFRKTSRVLIGVVALASFGWANAAISPSEALAGLQRGNARFVSGQTLHPNQTAGRRTEVAGGQTPFATILSCSDSRVPVEAIFDQGVGDLFVVRVIGNVSRSDEIGSIEYGTEHLDTPLVVVMGHSSCGAVKAAVEGADMHGHIPSIVGHITPAVAKLRAERSDLSPDELMVEAVTSNVWQSIDNLFEKSPSIRKQVRDQKLKVVGAVYDVASGSVSWLGSHPEETRLLAYTGDAGTNAATTVVAVGGTSATSAGLWPLTVSPVQAVLLIATMLTTALVMIFRGQRVRRRRSPMRPRVALSVGAGEH